MSNLHYIHVTSYILCIEAGTLDLLLKLPLAPAEDEQLVEVLQDDDRDLLVGHLLQRGRLLEAVEVDDKMNQEVNDACAFNVTFTYLSRWLKMRSRKNVWLYARKL